MEFSGKVFRKLDVQRGTSARGEWQKQDIVFESEGEFPRKLCVTFFGDKVADAERLNLGDMVTVSFNVEAREWNGKWFNDIRAWRVQTASATSAPQPTSAPASMPPFDESQPAAGSNEVDDLPF